MDKYVRLDLYPDAMEALAAIKDRKLAILSNGSTDIEPDYRIKALADLPELLNSST